MKMSDRYALKSMDHSAWTAKMVAEGKLVEPPVNKAVTFRVAAGTFDLDNIKCGILASGADGFNRSRDGTCQFISEAAGALTLGFNFITNEEFCQGAEDDTCTNLFDGLFAIAGAFVDGGLNDLCPQVFNEIFSQCPGGVGGTADVTLTRNDGQFYSGSVGAMNYEDDTGTCPANPITDTEVCKVQLAG